MNYVMYQKNIKWNKYLTCVKKNGTGKCLNMLDMLNQ